MNVRELVNVIKFKTDTASLKSAENAVNRIKTSMSKIPAMKLNTGKVTNQLNAIGSKMQQISTPRTIKIGSDTTAIQRTIDKLNELDRTNQRVVRGHYKAKTQGVQQPSSSGGGMSSLVGGLKGAFVALGGMAIVNEIKETADAMMSLSSRIKLVTKDDAERLKIEQSLYAMSNRNRASLQDLGDLYYKTASSAKQFGASQEDVLKLTDIVSKSLIVGGADTAQQKSTILQLSQALSSGVLQGDELRSLRENAPRLMQEIAKNMGVTMAGLKEMGAKGELTTERLMQAILQSGGAIEGEFARMTPTIGQALTVLGNKWDKFVLDIQNNTGFFGQIALFILDAIDWVGEAIDFVKEEFKDLEPEFTAFFGSLKELWTELQPFLNNLKEIFKTIIIPALKEFGKVALEVLTSVANLLKPIADLLSTISGLIVSAAKGLKGLIKNAESGALQQYKSYMAEYNQTNTFNLSSGVQLQPAVQSTREFFPTK
jgi:tape measure domain-containing protein